MIRNQKCNKYIKKIIGNLNFLEGCFHSYSPYNKPFPGVVLSTGTEDYFDSAWY